MPAYKNQKKTKQYSLEFKRSAVEMSLEDSVQVQQLQSVFPLFQKLSRSYVTMAKRISGRSAEALSATIKSSEDEREQSEESGIETPGIQ